MAHYRKPIGAALAINTAIFLGEGIAGVTADSLSLIMDAVHNLSDELALLLLFLAYLLSTSLSRHLVRSANLFNSIGLVAVSGWLAWRAVDRLLDPTPVSGTIPIVVGLAAALANWGVAAVLRRPARHDPAIRLAYLHNLGDAYVSLAPVLAGALVVTSGYSFFDPLLALLVALWIIGATIKEVAASRDELIWPARPTCGPNHR